MRFFAILIGLAGVSIWLGGCASVKSYDEMSSEQISALQESNQRLNVYDKGLQKLDAARANKKISSAQYTKQAADLTALIKEESEFQNAIMIKDLKIKVMAQNLLSNIQTAAREAPAIIGGLAMAALKGLSGATITP